MTAGWEKMLARQLDYAARPLTRHALLLAHLDFAWDRLRPRLDGLTDAEYLWEPVPGCWSVRRQHDGTFMADWASPEPDPAPFTNIAWRLSHIGFHLNLRGQPPFWRRDPHPDQHPVVRYCRRRRGLGRRRVR